MSNQKIISKICIIKDKKNGWASLINHSVYSFQSKYYISLSFVGSRIDVLHYYRDSKPFSNKIFSYIKPITSLRHDVIPICYKKINMHINSERYKEFLFLSNPKKK